MRLSLRTAFVLMLSLLFVVSAFASPVVRNEQDQASLDHGFPVGSSTPWLDNNGELREGGICGTRHYSQADMLRMEREQMESLVSGKVGLDWTASSMPIKVNFHVITDGKAGKVTAATINATISKMNAIFAGAEGGVNTGISFVWNNPVNGQPIMYTNRSWFAAKPGTTAEAEMKTTIGGRPENDSNKVLNIYTNSPGVYYGGTLLGWATFPWELAANPRMDGVVMNYIAMNNGGTTSYNAGDVVAHEVGHWLGLYHTFQGGCSGATTYDGTSGIGDLVTDTPPEASSASGCPAGRDTCAGDGVDPIDNYMDYSSNQCQTRFSAGQNQRLVLKSALRPGL